MYPAHFSNQLTGWIVGAFLVGLFSLERPAWAGDVDQEFAVRCAGCHSIGEGRRVGPDLQGVLDRRSEEWAVAFVQNSAALIASGDADAVALFAEYTQIPMPPQDLSAEEVLELLSLTRVAPSADDLQEAKNEDAAPVLEGSADRGQSLFQGIDRFEEKGPSCISCHSVRNDAVISGGILGPELTETLKGLEAPSAGQAKVGGFVQSQPIMQRAYADHPPTSQEIADLAAFLVRVNQDQAHHMPADTGRKLALSGVAGTTLLLGLYSLLWRNRKRGSVNQEIYDRQVKSTDL